jgi:hypothetical protein
VKGALNGAHELLARLLLFRALLLGNQRIQIFLNRVSKGRITDVNDKGALSFMMELPNSVELIPFEGPHDLETVTARPPDVVPVGAKDLGSPSTGFLVKRAVMIAEGVSPRSVGRLSSGFALKNSRGPSALSPTLPFPTLKSRAPAERPH